MPKKLHPFFYVAILLVAILAVISLRSPHARPTQAPRAAETKTQNYSISDAASPWAVVNKLRPLTPKTYTPPDLVVPRIPLRDNITSNEQNVRKETSAALEKMVAAADQQGVHMNLQSGYRSYDFQVSLYNGYVRQQGQAVADSQSARPGYSEHQTGLAADLGGRSNPGCDVQACFATTPEGKWLATNAYLYGFIIRYPEGKTPVTGYTFEPWHVRYIGTKLATEMHNKNVLTLEEYFGLPAAPDYK
jgi:D-alanyl-D-alanine carboxypeptidase